MSVTRREGREIGMDARANARLLHVVVLVAVMLQVPLIVEVARGADGAIEINHAAVMAGGITTGDAAGYPASLTEPGTYILTGNLTLANENTHGIEITSDDVTLDMRGFTIKGINVCNPCSNSGSGVGIRSHNANTVVRNGSVVGTGSTGVFLDDDMARVERVHVRWAGVHGIYLAGSDTKVVDSVAMNNGDTGIKIWSNGVVTDSLAFRNGGRGVSFDSGQSSMIRGCTSMWNGGEGIRMSSGGTAFFNVTWVNTFAELHIDPAPGAGSGGYGQNVLSTSGVSVSGAASANQIGINICKGAVGCP